MTARYSELDSQKIVETAEHLHRRIGERFPEAGLTLLAGEFVGVARDLAQRAKALRRPAWSLRAIAIVGVAGIIGGIVVIERMVEPESGSLRIGIRSLSEFSQALESMIGLAVFIGAAVFFLMTFETRRKRRLTLDAMQTLRSVAHIVDMHQLTKDPERITGRWIATTSSPRINLTVFELERYLDYCGEMLALISKVSALYIQGFPDSVGVQAVDEIEALTSGLQRKIWQKIVLLNRLDDE